MNLLQKRTKSKTGSLWVIQILWMLPLLIQGISRSVDTDGLTPGLAATFSQGSPDAPVALDGLVLPKVRRPHRSSRPVRLTSNGTVSWTFRFAHPNNSRWTFWVTWNFRSMENPCSLRMP
jgi:hypothetical protein